MKPKEVEGLRACMHETVDEYCNQLNNASEDQQIESAQLRAKDRFEDVMLDTVRALYNDQNEESTPLLLEDQQELRRRFRRHTLEMEGPGDQQPGESLYDRVLRFFQRLLQHLQKVWQDVLTWVEEKTARLSSAVKTVWDAVKSFFSSMFSSMHQVFLSPLQV
uniref:Interleukin 32 n=2 Tax=Rousettus aegyptiacus TaxID=9407 RepID=A0A7J8EZB8_ROUAE|nr:interleukin 32 [Rousettus aegyptiacus]